MSMTMTMAPKGDWVRAHTKPEINEKIDTETERRIRFFAAQEPQAISERLQELDREWDIERVLETNAASLILLGTLLGATASRKWFIVPLVVSGLLLRHALEG